MELLETAAMAGALVSSAGADEVFAMTFVSGLAEADSSLAAAGLGAGGTAGFPCIMAKVMSEAATNSVEASAPHLVLRFQNNAAIITGDMAAKPENANRMATSKIPCLAFK